MRPSGLLLVAAISLSLCAALCPAAGAATRPRYGGTLRLAIREHPVSLDPADPAQFVPPGLARLLFDTLITVDDEGIPQPALASAWQADPGNQRWQFSIRRGVTFPDGTAVNADAAAASLRAASPRWKVFAAREAVVIECESPTPDLPALLALPRYAIAKRSGGKIMGSGPFANDGWDPGKKLSLTARDDYWGGRAFVNAIDIEMGKSFREQMIALDLGKADVIEIAPEQVRRAVSEGRRILTSAPSEGMALVFSREAPSVDDNKLREALSLSIDRETMTNVLLQGGGEPAGSILPNWLSGYAFLFPTAVDLPRARALRSEAGAAPTWILGYDGSDPLSRVIAERIALNARDAGLTIQLLDVPAEKPATADVRLVRSPLRSLDARVALSETAAGMGLVPGQFEGDSTASLYAAENALVQSRRVIPLLHLGTGVALSPHVMGWQDNPGGNWSLPNLWLEAGQP